MAAGYFEAGKTAEIATFELYVRRLPAGRDYLIACGLEQALDYLTSLRFQPEEIAYLRGLPQFSLVRSEFFDWLAGLRFTGDVDAMAEGTTFHAGEPVVRVRAPIAEAQLVETWLLAMIGFQTLIATKASRLVAAAQGRQVVEFGTRRAHSPEAGVLAARAAWVGGCSATSNVLAGMRYGIPVAGTAAHSWVLSFEHQRDSFQRLQRVLGPSTVYLLDTYDTLAAADLAVELGQPLYGVRLDSGDLNVLSRQVRQVLDEGGLREARIMATGDLDEDRIAALARAGAPIDSFGVGTSLATSSDAPALGAIYKLVELESGGVTRYPAKTSLGKETVARAKQVFRYPDHDVIGLPDEKHPGAESLLQPVLRNGRPVAHRTTRVHGIRASVPVQWSPALRVPSWTEPAGNP